MIDKIKNWALLAPAFIPLVYADLFFFPLVAPKAFFFRIAVTVALIVIAILAYKGRELYISRLRQWWAWIPGLLLLVAYGTSLLGIDFYHSFWSVFDRSEGLIALTYIVAYTYLLMLTVTEKFIRTYFRLLAGVASIVALYAIFQWINTLGGLDIPGFLDADGRIGGTIGNAAFLAGFLGLSFFITLIVAREHKKYESWWLAGGLVQLIAILLTATRGTILALVAAGGVTLLYFAIQKTGNLRRVGVFGIGAFVVLGGLFIAFRAPLQNVPFEPVQRIASIGLEDATTASRLFVWENMFQKGLERPVTGYGAEHIDFVYNQFYNPQDILEQWFDRAHNQYLDYFVQFGVGGLLLFALLIAGIVRFAMSVRTEDLFAGNVLLLLTFTYLLQSFFVFDTLNTWIILFPLFAFGFVYIQNAQTPKLLSRGVVSILAVLSIPGLYFGVIEPARANLLLGEAYLYHVVDAERSAAAVQRGLALNTFADLEYGYQLYAMYTDRQQHRLGGDEKQVAYNITYQVLRNNVDKYPYDARTLVYLGHVIEARPNNNGYDQEENVQILNNAIGLSPDRSQPYYMLANIHISQANAAPLEERGALFAQALSVLEEYRDRAPDIAEPHLVLAELHNALGQVVEAEQAFARGVELYDGREGQDARRIAGYLLAQNRIAEALPYLEDANSLRKNDYVVMLDLAKARFLTGNVEGAAALVEVVQLEAPSLLETEFIFLESLRNAL